MIEPMTAEEVEGLLTSTLHGVPPDETFKRIMATLASWLPLKREREYRDRQPCVIVLHRDEAGWSLQTATRGGLVPVPISVSGVELHHMDDMAGESAPSVLEVRISSQVLSDLLAKELEQAGEGP